MVSCDNAIKHFLMEKADTLMLTGLYMKESLKMKISTGLAKYIIPMVINMKDIGKMAKGMEKVFGLQPMGLAMMANGKRACPMARES